MRITRAAKVAAFPLIVLALVGLIACTGPAGLKGDKGDKGDMGDMGGMGDMGPTGPAAFAVKSATPAVVRINDIDAGVGAAKTYDASGLFTGGGSRTYEAEVQGTNMGDLTVTNEDGGSMLTITLKATVGDHYQAMDAADDDDPGLNRMEIKVTATGENDAQAETVIYVVRNKAPAILADGAAIPDLLIGTQPAKGLDGTQWPGGDVYTCEMMNACVVTLVHDSGTPSDNHFTDDDAKLTYSAESEDSAKVGVTTTADGKLMITGMASTEKADGTNEFATEGVTITVTATDEGLIASEKKMFKVIVNAQPALTDVVIPAVTLEEEGARTIDVSHFLKDADDLSYTVRDNADANAHVTVTNTGGTRGAEVMLAPTENGLNGTREVKIRATEPQGTANREDGSVGQYRDFSIMVTNASN